MAETSLPTIEKDLLYFFLSGDRLKDLYKKLYDDKIITSTEYEKIKGVINNNYIFEINIAITYGELIEFTLNYSNSNSNNQYYNINDGTIDRLYNLIFLAGYMSKDMEKVFENKTNNIKEFAEKIKDELKTLYSNEDLDKLNQTLSNIDRVMSDEAGKLNNFLNIKNINCNIKCKFFIMNPPTTSTFYNAEIEKDKNTINKIFISDDYIGTNELNNYLNIILQGQQSDIEIILLPCLHSKSNNNKCNNDNGAISENCRMFNNTVIDTKLYTDFYGQDKIRKASLRNYLNLPSKSERMHCKDTNIISLVLDKY